MKNLVLLVLVGIILVGVAQVIGMYRAQGDLQSRLESRLDTVPKQPPAEVRAGVVADAQALGIRVRPEDVRISLEPTTQLTPAQDMVSGMARFENHRVGIQVDYVARPLGVKVPRHVALGKILEGQPIPLRQERRVERPVEDL